MGEAKATGGTVAERSTAGYNDVLVVMLFGGVTGGESIAQSDVDIYLVLYPKR